MKYLYNKKILGSTILGLLFISSQGQTSDLHNFNEPNTTNLISAIQSQKLHIVQLGDSHTAGDSLTDALRTTLQHKLGDGGMGWAMPMYFSGQRLARFGYDNQDFQTISSRNQHQNNYTLGGLIAQPKQNGATLTLKPKRGNEPEQRIKLSLRQPQGDGHFIAKDALGKAFTIEAPSKNNQWQLVEFNAKLPITLRVQNAQRSAIGGWWAFDANQQGAVVSALGINGAELTHINRWNTQAWKNELAQIRPHLIILAYGTNEAYNNVDAQTVKQQLTQHIQQIRQASPQTAIMIMGTPEVLKNTAGTCGTRPSQLTAIQQVQKQVAQSQNTLYWDWQQAMGGSCTMKLWMSQAKSARDGVHFTAKGYTQLGNQLAYDILALNQFNVINSTPPPLNHENKAEQVETIDSQLPVQTPVIQKAPFNPNGLATICTEDEQGQQQCNTVPAQNF